MTDAAGPPEDSPQDSEAGNRAAGRLRIDAVAEAFEAAWRKGPREPSIDDYLVPLGAGRAALLLELVRLDLEIRLARGEAVRLETYLERYPELSQLPEQIVSLAALEFRLLAARGEKPKPEALYSRFPAHADVLRRELQRNPVLEVQELQRSDCTTIDSPNDVATTRMAIALLPARYADVERLGSGGFGTVYKAFDTFMKRHVAIKVCRSSASPSCEVPLALKEAQNLALLRHPGIVQVFDAGILEDASIYIVMELIEGEDLRSRMARGRLPMETAITLVATVANALEHAHARGVVHRDLKPSNILLDKDGQPHVVDFGLALHDEDYSHSAETSGTLRYMAPEQAAGKSLRVDGRADVYSLGVVLYELLTGQAPYRSRDRDMLVREILEGDVRPLSQLAPNVPKPIESACMQALEKDPSRRFSSARQFADAIKGVAVTASGVRRPRFAFQGALGQMGCSVAVTLCLLLTLGGVFLNLKERAPLAHGTASAGDPAGKSRLIEEFKQANVEFEGGKLENSLDRFTSIIKTLEENPDAVDQENRWLLRDSYACRATVNDSLGRYDQAIVDWDRAIKASKAGEQSRYAFRREESRLLASQQRIAPPTGAAVEPQTQDESYSLASKFASLTKDSKNGAERAEFADRAMRLLQNAIDAGYSDVEQLKNDPELAPLRERDDFKKLVADLEAKQ